MTKSASKLTLGSKQRLTVCLKPSQNITGVINIEFLETRSKTLKSKCEDQSRMDWAKYDKDWLLHIKLREQNQIKSDKAQINKLMMELEQAEKVDTEVKTAEFKKKGLDNINLNVDLLFFI